MYYREAGDPAKPLMVLLHGGGVAGWMWQAQEAFFQDSFHLLIPDLPGHGQSAGEDFISITQTADALQSLIAEKQAGKRTALMGLSLGAQIAVELISRPNCRIEDAVIQSALVLPMPLTKALTLPAVKLTKGLVQNRRFAALQAKQLYIPETLFENYFEDSQKMSERSLVNMLSSNLSYALPEGYARASCNLLIVYGARERRVMQKSAEILLHAHSRAVCWRAEGAGHGVSLAAPDIFNHTVCNWLSK